MDNEYRVFLENLSFPSFSKLMEAATGMNKLVRRTPKPSQASTAARPFSRKRSIVQQLRRVKNQGLQVRKSLPAGRTKNPNLSRRESHTCLTAFPCITKKVVALLKQ